MAAGKNWIWVLWYLRIHEFSHLTHVEVTLILSNYFPFPVKWSSLWIPSKSNEDVGRILSAIELICFYLFFLSMRWMWQLRLLDYNNTYSLCEVRTKLINNMNILKYIALSESIRKQHLLFALIALNTVSVWPYPVSIPVCTHGSSWKGREA